MGRAQAARALLDERRWQLLRAEIRGTRRSVARYDGLTPIETLLTPDQITELRPIARSHRRG
jgi:manganese/zinc/iron transport system permease protein